MLKLEKLPSTIVQPQSSAQTTTTSAPELVRAAFDSPLEYPAVDQWLFPGDDISIVLQSNLPSPVEVLEAVLDYCTSIKLDLNDVTVVITAAMASTFGIAADQLVQAEAEIANGEPPEIIFITVGDHKVGCQVHDPSNTYGLAYLAANEAGDPVYVSRLLVDADVVIPVGCPTSGASAESYDCIYPDFGSTSRLEPFRAGTGTVVERTAEIELANDNLGSFFLIQIVSAPGGEISAAVAGARKHVIEKATELANEQWLIDLVPDVELVIATVEETGRLHSWDDFANALITAANMIDGDGPIVLWTSIAVPPDRSTRKALQTQFEESVIKKLSRKQRQIATIVSERPVFLHSELPQSTVEELGIGFIKNEDDVVRIAEKASSGILLHDAHKVCVNQSATTDASKEHEIA